MIGIKKERIWNALPWLIASGGLITLDFVVGAMNAGYIPCLFGIGVSPLLLVMGICFLIPVIDELLEVGVKVEEKN